ncbi:hypothetical protein C0995_003172 [Termitomyces sp. Mi166|nr:hypothetical protein C0995_003172 [Termitomyces sp. Mi166\
MTSAVFPEKRTRSQLTLPDDLLFQLSRGSPLKDARTAIRHNNSRTETATSNHEEIVEETDDELLLSPGKPIPTTRTTKRSVSPPPGDEYDFRPKSPSEGRELKRTKLDNELVALNGQPLVKFTHVLPSRPTHTRSLSQPASSKRPIRARSGIVGDSSADPPSQSVPGETESTGKGRARSVPLFPSSLPSGIVYIDLRNPPASPRRSKSRSPSKERELRIVSGPAMVAKLDTIQDEVDSAMNIEQDSISLPQPMPYDNKNPAKESTSGTTLEELLPPPTPSKKRLAPLVLPAIVEPPVTPMRDPSSLSPLTPIPLSPLTPIPETLLPAKSTSQDNRHVKSGWETSLLKEAQAPASPAPLKPSLGLATITKSRLPRPSSSTNLALSVKQPPKAVLSIEKPVASSTKPVAATPKVNNAFAVLMANARGSKDQVKGKGREMAVGSKTKTVSSSSTGLKLAGGLSKPQKGKAKEISLPKASLKNKMKPKMAQKPKPKPPSPVIPSLPPEVEKEKGPSLSPSSSLLRSHFPTHSIHSARATTPFVQDISMENINPVVETDVPMEVYSASAEPSHSDQALAAAQEPPAEPVESAPSVVPDAPVEPTNNEVLDEPHVSAMEDVGVSTVEDVRPVADAGNTTPIAPVEPSHTTTSSAEPTPVGPPINPPPAKPTTSKVHISKRKPSSIPAPTRITRSASLKRNQKVFEVPEALPTKATGKQALGKKSLTAPVFEVVASGSLSKSEVPPDTVPMSDPPSLSTDGTTLPPGSPTKNGSPTKQKTPGSSFAQPTKSTMSKQVSPRKSSLSKARSSSPNKVARSASMFSRPRASLSRPFTSYSTLEGSSLSTLSSALEKLQQRPPERPNTSMGFNRDDPDSSIELQATNKDDSSIQPSGSDDSKTASSSKGTAGTSRLVQRTLLGGPRSCVTGKFTVGSLGPGTHETGGFKVTGQPSKTGPRIFGVGSGFFSGAARARTMQKVSRKTSLPSVMASPVKGGNSRDAMDITDDDIPQGDAQDPDATPSDTPVDGMAPHHDKGKGREPTTESWNSDVSHASHPLSQSLNAPSTKGVGSMGPPATPKGRKGLRSVSSTYPSSSSGVEASGRVSPTRTSLRFAEKTPDKGASGSMMASTVSEASHLESLKFLKDCVIFVDVRNDDGDEVGSLFVEMLEGVGAKILTRVGQTCTHIVFKNGLMSTLNRYRLLRDPKPFVVGIAWVVECVEQRKHIDEAKFLVDLDGINISGTNKRRRSMLPKLISHDFEERSLSDVEADVSMDGSTSWAISFSDFYSDLTVNKRHVVDIPAATEARANVRSVLKVSKRTERGRKDSLQLVKVLEEYLPQLRGIIECLTHDEIALKSEPQFSWRTTLSANIFNTSPRLSIPGLQADLAFSLLTYAFALSNLARSTVNSLGRYEFDRAITESERKTKDDQLNIAVDFLCRASGIYSYIADTVILQWENQIKGGHTGFEQPPELCREVNNALAKMALADAQTLAIRKYLSKAAFDSNIAPGPPLPVSHPSPSLIAKMHLECASLYSSARSLVKIVGTRKRPSSAPDSTGEVSADLRRYLADQTALYSALAHKWLGVEAGEKGGSQKGGEAVGFMIWAKKELQELKDGRKSINLARGGDKDVKDQLKQKVADELQSVDVFHEYYKKANDSIHFQPIPTQADLQAKIPAGIMAIAAKPYVPRPPAFGPGSAAHLQAQTESLALDADKPQSPPGDTPSPATMGTYAGAGAYF